MIGNEDDSRQFGNRLRSKDAANKLLPGEIDDEDGRGQSSSEPYNPVGECSGEESRCPSKETEGSERRLVRTKSRTSHNSGKQHRTSVFGEGGEYDGQAVKDTIKETLQPDAKPYDVEMLYWKDGLWRKIATHEIFLNGTLAVISINALWMSVDTNYNDASSLLMAHPVFQIAEQLFCVYFSFEWFVRFMSFERKLDGRKDGWFVFDSILVALMLMETWGLSCIEAFSENKATLPFPASVLRLFRLLRLSRLMRMLRSLPELLILIKGMVTAIKSVVYVLALLILFLYVFGIAFKQLSSPYEFHSAFFESIPLAMYSLFIYCTFLDDLAYFGDSIRFESPECYLLSLVFIMLGSMTVMNMLVGVLCEVVGGVAVTEREEMAAEKARFNLEAIVDTLDTDKNKKIIYKEYREIFGFGEALTSLPDI
jgi:voltage-gated sodium channel